MLLMTLPHAGTGHRGVARLRGASVPGQVVHLLERPARPGRAPGNGTRSRWRKALVELEVLEETAGRQAPELVVVPRWILEPSDRT